MKINPNYRKENADDQKDSRSSRATEARRQNAENETAAAAVKSKQYESPVKEEMKFAGILKAANTPPKPKPAEDDSSDQQQRDDDKKEKRRADERKDSTEKAVNDDRVERYDHSKGGQFGGGFGAGGNINQSVSLSDNFAARSILHIADLERMISAIRTQTALGGKREILLELKRSVLDGLKVKVTIDPVAQVQIEFLAANEKIRTQIENHSAELAEILRGRGIKVQSLRTTLGFSEQDKLSSSNSTIDAFDSKEAEDSIDDNTFESASEN